VTETTVGGQKSASTVSRSDILATWQSIMNIFEGVDNQNMIVFLKRPIFRARRNARIASAVLATAIPSVCPFVRHTPVLCQNDGT